MNARHTPLLPHQTDRLNKRRKRRGTRKFKNLSCRPTIAYFYTLESASSAWVLYYDGKVREIKSK